MLTSPFCLSGQPSLTIPTAITAPSSTGRAAGSRSTGLEDLDFHVGNEALSNASTRSIVYPIRHGMVRFWISASRAPKCCQAALASCVFGSQQARPLSAVKLQLSCGLSKR